MDELIDILTPKGEHTGATAMKTEAHRKGLFHATVHVWFYNKNGAILLQKRAKNKEIHPSLWDVSVAGHIGAGEGILDAAVREIKEEIGLIISNGQLKKIGIFKSVQQYGKEFIDCEFHHTFLAELSVDLDQLTKQQSEVEDLQLWPIAIFEQHLDNPNMNPQIVPHDATYYSTILKEIKNLL